MFNYKLTAEDYKVKPISKLPYMKYLNLVVGHRDNIWILTVKCSTHNMTYNNNLFLTYHGTGKLIAEKTLSHPHGNSPTELSLLHNGMYPSTILNGKLNQRVELELRIMEVMFEHNFIDYEGGHSSTDPRF